MVIIGRSAAESPGGRTLSMVWPALSNTDSLGMLRSAYPAVVSLTTTLSRRNQLRPEASWRIAKWTFVARSADGVHDALNVCHEVVTLKGCVPVVPESPSTST